MPDRNGREFSEAWAAMLTASDYDRLPGLVHPDCVHEYPQSGERLRGLANIRAVFDRYPGGLGRPNPDSLQVAGDNERWTMAPNFTLVRTSGAAGSYTSAIKAQYPDGSEWYIISMFELVDGRQTRSSVFFAPLFDAPEWRRPFAEPMGDG
jgi:hypothetical protein